MFYCLCRYEMPKCDLLILDKDPDHQDDRLVGYMTLEENSFHHHDISPANIMHYCHLERLRYPHAQGIGKVTV